MESSETSYKKTKNKTSDFMKIEFWYIIFALAFLNKAVFPLGYYLRKKQEHEELKM